MEITIEKHLIYCPISVKLNKKLKPKPEASQLAPKVIFGMIVDSQKL